MICIKLTSEEKDIRNNQDNETIYLQKWWSQGTSDKAIKNRNSKISKCNIDPYLSKNFRQLESIAN